jgi:hemerythrin-like domain-containing protein
MPKAIHSASDKYKLGDKTAAAWIMDHARGYMELMLGHIDKEDNIFYPMGDQRFSKEKINFF